MSLDRGNGIEGFSVRASMPMLESGMHNPTHFMIDRWEPDQVKWVRNKLGLLIEPVKKHFETAKVLPYLTTEFAGNVITNAGWQALLASATASGSPMFTSTVGRIGAGNGTGTPVNTDTDLSAASGSSNRFFELMGAAPTVGSGTNRTWTFVATVGGSDGNFHWEEFGIDQGTGNGTTVTAVLFNHALSDQGTKTSGQVWTATATLSFT